MIKTLKTVQSKININQVYAFTSNKDEEELYNELEQALEITNPRHVTIAMRD